jgi:hypothetical protein
VENGVYLSGSPVEYGPGQPLSWLHSRAVPEVLEGAQLESLDPIVIALNGAQWAYGALFPLSDSRPDLQRTSHPIVVQIRGRIYTGTVGISVIDRSLSLISEELYGEPGDFAFNLLVEDPSSIRAVALRNAAAGGRSASVLVFGVQAFSKGSKRLARRHSRDFHLFVVLAPPKTGTHTIEQTIKEISPGAAVRRTHRAVPESTHQYRSDAEAAKCLFGQRHPIMDNLDYVAGYGDALRAEIETVRDMGGSIAFFTAFREPIGRGVACMFQALPLRVPVFPELQGIGPDFASLLMKGLALRWADELNGQALSYHSIWPSCLRDSHYYESEFTPLSGVDLSGHAFDRKNGFLTVARGNDVVVALRTSHISAALPRILSKILDTENAPLLNTNIGETKNYSELYQEFLKGFRLPRSLVDSIYKANPWTSYFYTDDEIELFKCRWEIASD